MIADYVIVGSGSAGSALAYRLSEAGHTVIVVEYGGSDAGPFIQMPAALSYPMNMARYDSGLRTEPEPEVGRVAPILAVVTRALLRGGGKVRDLVAVVAGRRQELVSGEEKLGPGLVAELPDQPLREGDRVVS